MQFVRQSERYWFYGIILTGVGYGANLVLFIACVGLLYRRVFPKGGSSASDTSRYHWDVFSLGYTLVMFGFATASIVLEVMVEERAFVEFRTAPDGPSLYLYENVFGRVTTLAAVYAMLIACHYCAVGLLTWRCLVIYKSLGIYWIHNYVPMWVVVMVVPFCLLVASIGESSFYCYLGTGDPNDVYVVAGIIFMIQVISPSKLLGFLASQNWVIIWGCIAVVLTWTLTGSIVMCLLVISPLFVTYRITTRRARERVRTLSIPTFANSFGGDAEEFELEPSRLIYSASLDQGAASHDWDDSETDLAHLGGAAPGAAKSGGDKLWEDNWDDDDIEDDFSVQLRSELEKTKKAKEAAGESMQT
ncbi:hypothetical protein P691DRAFT_785763 [Macrolepiota fuliginosa MF-IS2]|uniref:26S proteasome complex subunit SEM1 n=1 Tax=Macrolepiota fuliginosa MF-IS2 TaxID=1400762 RepID=A0A9P6C876_9AGAR|nr:hypothetical protein P691DRAFT_785763 [Macrolepiota fuliginosa MF-IS2]